jgi:serine protease Do
MTVQTAENMSARGRPLTARRSRRTAITVALSTALAASQVFNPVWAARAPSPEELLTAEITTGKASFADLIAQVKPAVVNISTTAKVAIREYRPQLELPSGTPFEEFFQRFFDHRLPDSEDRNPAWRAEHLGSGFIVDPAGYVVTNNHVIDGAEKVTVTLNDGSQYLAELVGRDSKTDLALLKIEAADPLPYVSFAEQDKARVGDWVIAIGNPFGLGGTATTGIVSARGRDLQSGPYDDYIQIDAPINRGNSGGPLFDTAGQVIGVNTAIYSPSGGNIGIGFAIPSDLAKSVVAELREDGRVERGWLGVQIQGLTPTIAESLGLKDDKGALVASVVPGSPADKAGIRPGDVILRYDGEELERMRDLPQIVAETETNDRVELEVWRQGEKRTLKALITPMPDEEQVAAEEPGEASQSPARLGVALAALTPEVRARYGLAEDVQGVLIVSVQEGSPAARQGLRAGDVIKMVGQTPVSAPADVAREVKGIASAERQAVLLLVARGDQERFVAVKLA